MNKSPKIACIGTECVACGCCVTECPLGTIKIVSGVTAQLDEEKCVGCGRCAKKCPAGVITIIQRRICCEEKEVV